MGAESRNTVAGLEVDGNLEFGVNGSISPETLENRRRWFNEIQWSPPRETTPTGLNRVQALSHAEAISLLTAKEKHGALSKSMIMFVDCVTCPFCIRDLPIIMRYAGVDELTIYTLGKAEPLILHAVK